MIEQFRSCQLIVNLSYYVTLLLIVVGGHIVIQTWIVGKWTWAKDQQFAPPGTFFHQFVVPVIQEVRKDCTYGQLAGMCLPKDVKGLRTCEVYIFRPCSNICLYHVMLVGLSVMR